MRGTCERGETRVSSSFCDEKYKPFCGKTNTILEVFHMAELGAMGIVGFIFMAYFVIRMIKIDNENLKRMQAWKQADKWNWD